MGARRCASVMSTVLAMSAPHEGLAQRNTNGNLVGVDNRASHCISDRKADFSPGILKPTKRLTQGFRGAKHHGLLTGTMLWRVEDDNGGTHVWKTPGHFCVPDGQTRLSLNTSLRPTQLGPRPRPAC